MFFIQLYSIPVVLFLMCPVLLSLEYLDGFIPQNLNPLLLGYVPICLVISKLGRNNVWLKPTSALAHSVSTTAGLKNSVLLLCLILKGIYLRKVKQMLTLS